MARFGVSAGMADEINLLGVATSDATVSGTVLDAPPAYAAPADAAPPEGVVSL
jgi:hypothetical protein